MNYMPPPWGWGYPPPPNKRDGITRRDVDRAVKQAIRLLGQEKFNKRKRKDEIMKKAAASKARFFTALEWWILGILAYPIVGPLYNMLIHYVNK